MVSKDYMYINSLKSTVLQEYLITSISLGQIVNKTLPECYSIIWMHLKFPFSPWLLLYIQNCHNSTYNIWIT